MTQCRTFPQAMANRFILGIFESAITPGQTLMTGFWYTRTELPLRQFICKVLWLGMGRLNWILHVKRVYYVFTSSSVPNVGAVAGISTISDDAPGPAKWQYMWLGGVTIIWGVFVWFALSDSPPNAWFLNEEERIIAVKRVSENQTGIKNGRFKKEQDPKMYILFVAIFAAAIPNGVLR
ncbi:hypothetical protein VNI00_014640 [Paramarasmius palmivorus]|uniref:Uncharacterized protein n=1 Tax=Paramarasmius palmivorus TaxID=297713 RepID=A0AAW0BTF1_9AGAR